MIGIPQIIVSDRAKWLEGPWKTEPDWIYYIDEETGFDILIKRNELLGHLCGYVGIFRDHPYYQINYMRDPLWKLDVYGGHLSFSGFYDGKQEIGICDPLGTWWLGFDCSQGKDYLPGIAAALALADPNAIIPTWRHDLNPANYKDIDFVLNECKLLAKQLKDVR